MLRRLFFSAMLCAPLTLAGCGFEAPLPRRTPAPPTPPPPLSSLSADIAIPAAQIAKLLDNMTEYRIADLHNQPVKCGIGQCRLDLTATRSGPITVAAREDALEVRLPFAVKAALAASGLLRFLHAQADGQGIATAHVNLNVSPELRLHADTSGTVALDNGHLRIGPLVTNIAQVWNENQEALTHPLWRSLDKQIAALPLRSRLAAFWTEAFTPLRIGKAPAAWLVLRPEQLAIAQPRIRDNAVEISLGLAARGGVVVQDTRPVNNPTPLPHAGVKTVPSNEFFFSVPLLLPYDRAAQLATASLVKRPPQIAGLALRFEQLQILPSGQDVVVAAKFCAGPSWDPLGWFASCGTAYLRGTPRFDTLKRTIRVANLHYDVASADLMLRVLHAMAGEGLAKYLESHLTFDESREIARLESNVTTALAKPQGRDLSISAQVESFGEPSFTWTGDGFLALFSARGKLSAQLNL